MLVLTRKVGEKLLINNEEIEITILNVKGNQIRIGINAPKEVSINREEIHQRIKNEERANKK